MFVGAEIRLGVSFEVARARLARLAHGGWLMDASAEAYGEPAARLVRVGPLGSVPGISRLVEVRFRELAEDDDHAVLALRWEAVGASGGLFPALDADLTLSRVDDQSSACKVSGVYRPPLGALGAGLDRMILNKVAAATIRKLMTSTGNALTAAPENAGRAPAGPQPGWSWLAVPELPLAPEGTTGTANASEGLVSALLPRDFLWRRPHRRTGRVQPLGGTRHSRLVPPGDGPIGNDPPSASTRSRRMTARCQGRWRGSGAAVPRFPHRPGGERHCAASLACRASFRRATRADRAFTMPRTGL